ARLSALGVGAALLAWLGREAVPALPHGAPAPRAASSHRRVDPTELAALAVAIGLVAASTRASRLPQWGQLALVIALAVPALLLRFGDARRDGRASGGARAGIRAWWPIAALVAAWVGWRILLAHHDSRAADIIDVWKNLEFFVQAANTGSDALGS